MSDTRRAEEVLLDRLDFALEILRHERRMRRNADNIICIANTRIKKMSKKIAHLEATIESLTGSPREHETEEATK